MFFSFLFFFNFCMVHCCENPTFHKFLIIIPKWYNITFQKSLKFLRLLSKAVIDLATLIYPNISCLFPTLALVRIKSLLMDEWTLFISMPTFWWGISATDSSSHFSSHVHQLSSLHLVCFPGRAFHNYFSLC